MSRPLLHSLTQPPTRTALATKTSGTGSSVKTWVGKIILSLAVLAGGYLIGWRWWVVKTIDCQSQGATPVTLACPTAQGLLHQPMLSLDVSASRWSNLTMLQDDQQRWWYLTGWRKQLPNTVKLTYAQSQPKYQLTQDGQTWWLITEVGLGQSMATTSADLPVTVQASWSASVARQVLTDQKVDFKLHSWILALQSAAKTQPEALQKITLIDQFTAELQWPGWIAVVSPDQDPRQQLDRLRQAQTALTEKAKTLGKDFHKVDLRFRLPVLTN